MNTEVPRQKPPRRYAFACVQCRRRKIRCGGEQPACRRCRQSSENCHYAQRATESRLEHANARIEKLEAELAQAKHSILPRSSSTAQADTSGASPNIAPRNEDHSEPIDGQDDISPHIGFDEHGDITYHGPTSRFSVGGLTGWHVDRPSQQIQQSLQKEHVAALQNNYVLLGDVWEPLVHSKTKEDLGADPSLVHRLLNSFWTWQYPLHNYLYRPCFIMDMALGGPYYSKFLLQCILSLSARHLDSDCEDNEVANKGEKFLSAAKELLMGELGATKPRIPTIQGLLVLSGRQCAVGKTSEGWLYLGMAIRMMTDLGLHLNFQELMYLEKLTPVELEVRKRLYCSAYIWDKSLSLSLGRPPALTRLPLSALEFLDQADDGYAWLPPDYPDYPSTDANQTTCFTFFCRLGAIIELLMLPLPNRASIVVLKERQTRIEDKLRQWHDDLPTALKMASDCEICPPPHVLSLNVLYHTLYIILWRPYLDLPETTSHATTACIDHAQTVNDMFMVYGRTFHWQKMTYLVSYCVYTAATVQVHEMKSLDLQRRQDAAKRLAVSLQVLEGEARQTPGIRRSIDIIKRQLRSWTPDQATEQSTISAAPNTINVPTVSDSIASAGAIDQSWQVPLSSERDLDLNHSGALEMPQNQPVSDFGSTWEPQQDQVSYMTGNDFGLGFVDTSAGFHLSWSFDETSNFNFFDTSFLTANQAL